MKPFDFKTEYNKTIVGDKFVEERINPITDKTGYFVLKRLFDILLSIFGIILSIIPTAIIILFIKLTSAGPVFYYQERLGQYGNPFYIIKFRTMKEGAEEESGPKWAEKYDSRVTRFGKILRKFHLDELPQFINVLKGDMSIVGPRPERPCFYEEFSKYIDGFDQRLYVPQGITGLAQVSGGYDLEPEEKIIYDLQYMKTLSIFRDLLILGRTFIKTGR